MSDPILETVPHDAIDEPTPEWESLATEADRADSGPRFWVSDWRSLRQELRQPRYLGLLLIVLVAIAIQLWLLF